MDKEQKEKRDTPITDGDARPDMPAEVENKKGKKGKGPIPVPGTAEKKFESERASDVNSLEDYKDSK
jgi:hypothetical protein